MAGQFLVSENSGKVEVILGEILKSKNLKISTAESCTGGMIASMLTSVSGSSAYYFGTIVSYDTSVKINVLNVDEKVIEEFTVVSEQVAEQMAKAVKNVLNTNIAISTTGVAGPNREEDKNDVGTVWISVTNGNTISNKRYFYPFLDREDFIKIVSTNTLNDAVKFIQENY